MEDHIVEVSKKYGITADKVKKKLEEVGKYLKEDVVPDKEYKNQ
ncbi:subtilisin-like serine protease [Leptotrichia trevisanii]|nr:subtilisin-like serine protease [Leptotrichia trevisanii]